MKDLVQLESQALTLAADAPFDRLLELQDAVSAAGSFLKEIKKLIDERMFEYVTTHGPVTIGDMLWVVSADKDYKAKFKPPQMAERLMELTGGDWEKFGGLLASGAFKHGAVRKACQEINEALADRMFDDLFETVVKQTVEGKPAKSLKRLDKRFV
jgi:hypothetical protein